MAMNMIYFFTCLASLIWISPCVFGENVMVHILRQTTSNSCSLPSSLDVIILRHEGDDVTLSLKVNEIVRVPSHVVLMSSNEGTGGIEYNRVKVSETHKAYHSVEKTASFIITCSIDRKSEAPFYILEGTFFYKDSKFKLHPTLDDVIVGPIDVTAYYVMEEVEEFNNPEDHEFIEIMDSNRPSTRPAADPSTSGSPHHRNKRAVTNYFIDVLPVIDFHLYERWLVLNNNDVASTAAAITTYMTNVFTAMSLRVSTLSLDNNVVLNLRMVTPYLSTSAATSPYSEDNKESLGNDEYRIDVNKQLDAFKDWIVGTPDLEDNDHTMLFTGYTVYGGMDGDLGNLTRGLAYVGGICEKTGYSSSIVQDSMSYQSEPVAVHELGHSLGSKHDGDGNTCNSFDRYIMSNGTYTASISSTLNPFTFSTCSSEQISAKILELEDTSFLTDCLTSQVGIGTSDVAPLSATDQCQSLFGGESYVCRGEGIPTLSQICTSLFCSIPGTSTCRLLLPATGTCCGNGKYCIEGVCSSAPSGQCVMDEVCPLEDQTGIVVQGKTCQNMDSTYCYNDAIKERCCRACQSHKTEIQGCEYGDKHVDCDSSGCEATLQSGIKYNFICCETCAHTTCHDQPGIVFQGSTYTCPQLIETFGKHYCYFQVIHISYCCMTCEETRSTDQSCLYGDSLHLYKCQDIPALGRACNEKEKTLCCETCKTITVSGTTASGVDTPDTATALNGDQSTTSNTDQSTQGCSGNQCGGAESLTMSVFALIGSCLVVLHAGHHRFV